MFDVTRSESQSAVLRFFLKYLILEGEAKAGLKLESAQAGAARKKKQQRPHPDLLIEDNNLGIKGMTKQRCHSPPLSPSHLVICATPG